MLRRFLVFARQGTEVILIPGNHDKAVCEFVGLDVAGVRLRSHDVHETADGRQLLVTHGDQYDEIHPFSPTLRRIGEVGYDCGEWVESCTLLAEHDDGRLELIDGLTFDSSVRRRRESRPRSARLFATP